jgi:hypothetical protein
MVALLRLLESLSQMVPLPVLAVIGAAAVVFVGPAWWNSLRLREIRGLVRRIGRQESVPLLTERAFRVAGNRSDRLAHLASEAHRRALPALRDQAFLELESVDPQAAAAQRAAIAAPPRTGDRHPVAAAAAIETLIASEAWEAAATRLAEARARFPDDPDLAALQERVRPPAG